MECTQEDTELSRLMHDLQCKNAEDMHSKILADRVYELKERWYRNGLTREFLYIHNRHRSHQEMPV